MADGRLSQPQPIPTSSAMQRAYAAAERPQTETVIVPMGSRRGISQPEDRHAGRVARRPFLLSNDLMLVRNEEPPGEDGRPGPTWRFAWDHKVYDVPPGHQLPVPFPAVVNMLGDPRSADGVMTEYRAETGEHGLIPTRYETMCSLFARYGIKEENVDDLVAFAPRVSVTTMTGEPVDFPALNPAMEAFPVPKVAERGRERPTDTRQIIERYESEMEYMRGELDRTRRLVDERLGAEPQDRTDEGLGPAGARPDTGPQTGI